MSRKVDKLIAQVRRMTENNDFSDTEGIETVEFLQYLNDAQHRLQSVITATHPTVFVKEKLIDVSAGNQIVEMPDDALMNNKVTTVEYSPSGSDDDFYHLEPSHLKRRDTSVDGFPVEYIRRSGKLLLQPTPSSGGTVRLNYVKRIFEFDIRRGKVLSSSTSGNSVTSLFADTSIANPALDSDEIADNDYICIVDKDGTMLMRNIPIGGINTATGEISIEAGYTFEDGETIPVGSFIVTGRDRTTHSEFPQMCERYFIAYAAWKILKRDSSVDFSEQQAELLNMEQEIVNSFADIEDDVRSIPILNAWEDWTSD